MAITEASAPGKIIVFGEHAVVYGRPAIAAPVTQVRATATVEDSPDPGLRLRAPDIRRNYRLRDASEGDPFAKAVRVLLGQAGLADEPALTVTVRSTIPIASGLGSGAAMAAAVIRAMARHLGRPDLAQNARVSAMTYQVEQLLHGTPSGIDNTVVSFERPIYFVRREPANKIERLPIGRPLTFLIGDTGIASPTKVTVGSVRREWQARTDHFDALFDGCGRVAEAARRAMEQGDAGQLGRLMVENQAYLREMTVSSPELERLIQAAEAAGALGAKLSGGGRGGNMIALVNQADQETVRVALLEAGARAVLSTVLA